METAKRWKKRRRKFKRHRTVGVRLFILPQIISDEVQEVSKGWECRTVSPSYWGCRFHYAVQLPVHGAFVDDPQRPLLGNCMILKPSEQVPLSAPEDRRLLKEVYLRMGYFNIVNGDKEIVEAICAHPGIHARPLSAPPGGGIVVPARHLHLKRALCLGGAKNHLIVLPDANRKCPPPILRLPCRAAGQRCMHGFTMVVA